MSVDMDNITDYNSVEINENVIFVNLLSKHKIILKRPATSVIRRKQDEARIALTEEFNQKCHTNLTVKQILRKLNNVKTRLKDKDFKNSTRIKQLPYFGWEKKFLDLWEKYGISAKTGIKDQPKDKTSIPPEEIIMSFEADYNSLEDGQNTSSEISTQHFEPASETEPEPRFKDTEGAEYENLSLDELKRGVLISQMKTLKAQEAAAIAKEKLDLYKLSLLQKNEVVIKSENEW